MLPVVRQGDANAAGGIAVTGNPSVLVNGRPVVTVPTSVSPHPCCGKKGCAAHCNAKIIIGSKTVLVGGRPVAYVGSADSCGHNRSAGSTNVLVGK